jgi:hypothetical protein
MEPTCGFTGLLPHPERLRHTAIEKQNVLISLWPTSERSPMRETFRVSRVNAILHESDVSNSFLILMAFSNLSFDPYPSPILSAH